MLSDTYKQSTVINSVSASLACASIVYDVSAGLEASFTAVPFTLVIANDIAAIASINVKRRCRDIAGGVGA